MNQLSSFLLGCSAVVVVSLVVNVIFKKQPKKADLVIDYVLGITLAVLLGYGIVITDWQVAEERLSKDLKDYRETQKNIWRR